MLFGNLCNIESAGTMSQAATKLRPHACRDSAGVKCLRKEVICRVLPLAADSAGDVRSACATALASFAPLLTSDAPGQFRPDLLGAEEPTKGGDQKPLIHTPIPAKGLRNLCIFCDQQIGHKLLWMILEAVKAQARYSNLPIEASPSIT